MDDYKVVCGLDDGMVCVFDQRNAQKLWEFHNRYACVRAHFCVCVCVPQQVDVCVRVFTQEKC